MKPGIRKSNGRGHSQYIIHDSTNVRIWSPRSLNQLSLRLERKSKRLQSNSYHILLNFKISKILFITEKKTTNYKMPSIVRYIQF